MVCCFFFCSVPNEGISIPVKSNYTESAVQDLQNYPLVALMLPNINRFHFILNQPFFA